MQIRNAISHPLTQGRVAAPRGLNLYQRQELALHAFLKPPRRSIYCSGSSYTWVGNGKSRNWLQASTFFIARLTVAVLVAAFILREIPSRIAL
jgi:hypothetical protein